MASLDVELDNDNILYVTGINPGIETVDSLPFLGNMFISQFDPSRQLIWSTHWGSSAFEYIMDIEFDSDSSFFVVGETKSNTFPTLSPGRGIDYQDTLNGSSDAFVARFINNQPVWAMYLGGDNTDVTSGICLDGSGNLYLCGTTHSTNFPVLDSDSIAYFEDTLQRCSFGYTYNGDAFFTKMSVAGQRLHSTYYGGTSDDGFSDIEIDTDGNLFITGSTASSSIPFASPNLTDYYVDSSMNDDQDGLILSLYPDLSLRWTSYFGGSVNINTSIDGINGMTITSDNSSLFIVGASNSQTGFPWVESSNSPTYNLDTITASMDGFISRFSLYEVISIGNRQAFDQKLIVYQDPVTSTLFILSKEQVDVYRIYNITGQLIASEQYKDFISVNQLTPGIYILIISVGNENRIAKFVKK